MRKFNPAVNVEHKWLSDCVGRNALLGLLINYIITIAPAIRKSQELPLMTLYLSVIQT